MFRFCSVLLAFLFLKAVWARDLGQWENTDPAVSQWYRSLMQPDNKLVPCCGTADAWYCDEIHVREGRTYCNITDDRDDEPLRRHHVPVGTEIQIPDHKLKYDNGNPTGHAVVFLNVNNEVYCFVQGSGI